MDNIVARACDKTTGRWIEVWYDEGDFENPMRDWDWDCRVEIYHRDYEGLGMKHDPSVNYEGGLKLPLRAYEHGGIAFSLGDGYPFNDPWDSYGIGFIGMTKDQIDRACGGDKVKATSYMNDVIDLLNAYANGNIYGFSCYAPDGDIVESCGGFYDTYDTVNGIFEEMAHDIPDEWRGLAKELDWGQLDPLEVTITRRVKREEA